MTEVPVQIERLQFGKSQPYNWVEALLRATPRLLDGGRQYADYLNGSYRGYNVGNGSLATDGSHYYGVYGGNYKAGATTNTACAEKVTVRRAINRNIEVLAFCLDAPTQPDKKTGQELPALLPCSRLCLEDPETLEHPLVNAQAVVISRNTGTYDHVVVSKPELGLVYSSPEQAQDVVSYTVTDPEYLSLLGDSIQKYRLLQQDRPAKSFVSPATEVRLAWTTPSYCTSM